MGKDADRRLRDTFWAIDRVANSRVIVVGKREREIPPPAFVLNLQSDTFTIVTQLSAETVVFWTLELSVCNLMSM